MAITSKKINLDQLCREIGKTGLIADFSNPEKKFIAPDEHSTITEKELEEAIAKHIAIDEAEAKAAARQAILDRLGLTEEEARLLLGGN